MTEAQLLSQRVTDLFLQLHYPPSVELLVNASQAQLDAIWSSVAQLKQWHPFPGPALRQGVSLQILVDMLVEGTTCHPGFGQGTSAQTEARRLTLCSNSGLDGILPNVLL